MKSFSPRGLSTLLSDALGFPFRFWAMLSAFLYHRSVVGFPSSSFRSPQTQYLGRALPGVHPQGMVNMRRILCDEFGSDEDALDTPWNFRWKP
jgi:hypothetical protein